MNKRQKRKKVPAGRVAELFAGVGGFRLGLEEAGLVTVFSNQWEPSTKKQHASRVYIRHFGEEGHSCEDIAKIESIRPKFDILVGGFPCQDYSVAKSLGQSRGINGKKGVLWWEIYRLVQKHKPRYVFLENVDRLLKSPSNQRGRDFAVMLSSLGNLGYLIEWRVVNAAEYGFPQRRIRVFIVAKRIPKRQLIDPLASISKSGILARAFPAKSEHATIKEIEIDKDLSKVSRYFNRSNSKSPFLNAGIFYKGTAHTLAVTAAPKANTKFKYLKDVLQSEDKINESFFIPASQLPAWIFLKGAKSIKRVHKGSGVGYKYSEGAMAFPDALNKPSRTILTAEGGSTPSRFKHVIRVKDFYRRLTPVELERLNGFPDDWTKTINDGEVLPDGRRAFLMGNAVVVGLVTMVGKALVQDLQNQEN